MNRYRLLRALPVGTLGIWLMLGAIAWVVPAGLWRGDVPLALLGTLAVAVAGLPALLRWRYHLVLPQLLEFLIVLQLFLHTFWGVWLRCYDSLWFWDKLLHVQGAMVVSFLGFLWLYSLHATGKVRLSGPLLGLFTVLFGNALGAWWEIAEFVVDKTLGKNTQYGLDNTMWDLINNLIGSLLAAGLAWCYLRHVRAAERRRLAEAIADTVGSVLVGPLPEREEEPTAAPDTPQTVGPGQ